MTINQRSLTVTWLFRLIINSEYNIIRFRICCIGICLTKALIVRHVVAETIHRKPLWLLLILERPVGKWIVGYLVKVYTLDRAEVVWITIVMDLISGYCDCRESDSMRGNATSFNENDRVEGRQHETRQYISDLRRYNFPQRFSTEQNLFGDCCRVGNSADLRRNTICQRLQCRLSLLWGLD